MGDQRRHSRVICDSPCDLVNRDGSVYPALLSDISAGGARVRVDHKPRLHEGDLIALKLNNEADFYPAKHISRIVRIDATNSFALRFLVNGAVFKNR